MANFWRKRVYQDGVTEERDLARRGFVYETDIRQNIGAGLTASMGVRTSTLPTTLYAENITTIEAAVSSSLFEGYTWTASSGSIPNQNLNRNLNSGSTQVFASVSFSGAGTLVHSLLAGSGEKVGAASTEEHLLVLKPQTTYTFLMRNLGNQTATTQLQLIFSENEPDYYTVITEPNISNSGTT